ncbi:MAG: M24 family metallopeptidase C-terminal domain-containing protein, partial [Calditrichales bacterium]|nr:M24 family metallopeptidase C-terminal domain-containing protein [Calditrichales bacterium]
IETLVNVVKDEEKSNGEFEFYKFETATLCPIDLKLIEKSLLTDEEVEYLNAYHKRVRETLSSHLKGEALAWLEKNTEGI